MKEWSGCRRRTVLKAEVQAVQFMLNFKLPVFKIEMYYNVHVFFLLYLYLIYIINCKLFSFPYTPYYRGEVTVCMYHLIPSN